MSPKRRVQVDLKAVETSEQWLETVTTDDMFTHEEIATAEYNLCIREIDLAKSLREYLTK